MICLPCQAAKTTAQVLSGNAKPVAADTQAARLEACKRCPELTRFQAALPQSADIGLLDRCRACGCVLRAKAAFEFDCPLGKWT